MTEKETRIYICEHCGKHSLSKGAMTLHERACHKNPKNMPVCFDCYWFKNKPIPTVFTVPNEWYDPEGYGCKPYKDFELETYECEVTHKNLYWKFKGEKEKPLKKEGWERCPMMCDGCKDFLSIDDGFKVEQWFDGIQTYGFQSEERRPLLDFFREKKKITPEIVNQYRKEHDS